MLQIYTCIVCNNSFVMGLEGVFDYEDDPYCDKCAGIERDLEGNAWRPGETAIVYTDIYGENPYTVTREEAFTKEKI